MEQVVGGVGIGRLVDAGVGQQVGAGGGVVEVGSCSSGGLLLGLGLGGRVHRGVVVAGGVGDVGESVGANGRSGGIDNIDIIGQAATVVHFSVDRIVRRVEVVDAVVNIAKIRKQV